jgi:hypothetical protein
MKLKDFAKLPTIFRNREQKINEVSISNIIIDKQNDYITISAVTNNKHNTQFYINTKTGETKVFCDCASFNFEFARVLYKHRALLNAEYFIEQWKRTKPRKTNKRKNPYNVPSGCKHVIKLARFIMSRRLLTKGGN